MSAPPTSRSSTSDSPVNSPLARAPKFSPPKSRNVSPARRPLHDRSNSQTNQFAGPTIRIVEDPGTDVYSKTPFPSQPSQILPPRNAPGYAFERRGSGVSDRTFVANVVAKFEANQTLVPKPLQHKKAVRHSTSTSTSEADTLVASSFSPSSSRFSQGTTPPSSPPPDSSFLGKENALEVLEEVPPLPKKSTIRAVTPSTSSSAEAPLDALTPQPSAAPLASSASTASPAPRNAGHQRGSSHTSLTPSSGKGHKHTRSSGSDKKQASPNYTVTRRPESKASFQSFPYSDSSVTSERPRSSSQPSPTLHEARTATLATGVRVHYPVVRASSASSLWAESQELPTITSRMNNRASQVHQWSSQLSTIASESERGSRSIERNSRSLSARSQSQSHDHDVTSGRAIIPRRRQTVGSVSSSDNVSADSADSSVAMPLPLFSPITGPSNDTRDSDELHDTISPLQSPPLRKKRSGFLRRIDSSDSHSISSSRPGSSQSDLSTFVASTIPPWARVYYRRGERASLGAPESSTDSDSVRIGTAQSGRTATPPDGNFPLSIYRPRNRPHQRISHPETFSISEDDLEQDVYAVGPARGNLQHHPFSPRLRPDRRSQARLSAWKAPSLDENLGSMLFSRQNRQILLFTLGFIFPFAWMIASFLPLPANPEMSQIPTPSQMDLERQLARDLGPMEDKSYQKAHWWRNLNRIMSGLGTLLVGVIIALAILASRMA